MKTIRIVLAVFTLSVMFNVTTGFKEVETETTISSRFTEGFEDGYCEGWKDVKGQLVVCPVTPVAPVPNAYQSSDSYKDGYNTGFKVGIKAAKK